MSLTEITMHVVIQYGNKGDDMMYVYITARKKQKRKEGGGEEALRLSIRAKFLILP